MMIALPYFVVPSTNITGDRFTTGTYLSASIISFVNSTTGGRYAPYFANCRFASKDNSIDSFSI